MMQEDHLLAFRAPAAIASRQEELLRAHVDYCRKCSPYYRAELAETNPASLTLERLTSLPLTDKTDMARCNDDFLAADRARVADIVFSSGTTGEPIRMMYTTGDLQRLAYNEMLAFTACGMTPQDTVLLTCTLDRCFIAGLAYFAGGCKLGATMIRNGHGTLESHERVIRKTNPTVLVGVPSFLRKLGACLAANGIAVADLPIAKLICIGEPVRTASLELSKLGEELEASWGATVYSTYASSETITSFCECTARQGGHLHADLGIVEIVDDAGRPLPAGAMGEVVVTPLQIEGMPLLRFKTGDISSLHTAPCPCGRNTPRLGPIVGRKNQMLKVQGTTLYPPAVFAALDELPGVREYCLIADHRHELSDQLTLCLALAPETDDVDAIKRFLQARLRVVPAIELKTEAQLRRMVFPPETRKPVRFIDRRG